MNAIFMPMFLVGLQGVSRRLWDQSEYELGLATMKWVRMSSWSAWVMGLAQIPFIINFFMSLGAKKTVENPWQATTLEWAAPSPPPHGNFAALPVVYRGPYEYSVPGHKNDFSPQHIAMEA